MQESAGWGLHTANLSDFLGHEIELTFLLKGDSTVQLGGLAIDDVAVMACSAHPLYLPLASPCQDKPGGTDDAGRPCRPVDLAAGRPLQREPETWISNRAIRTYRSEMMALTSSPIEIVLRAGRAVGWWEDPQIGILAAKYHAARVCHHPPGLDRRRSVGTRLGRWHLAHPAPRGQLDC